MTQSPVPAAGSRGKIYVMSMIAVMTAVTCVLAPLSIPIGEVPISFTNLVIYFTLYLLGWKRASVSYIVYMLIGMVGVPVFSGFAGGLGKLAGSHRRLHHRLFAYGGDRWLGHRPHPQPDSPTAGNGSGHRGVLRSGYGLVLFLHQHWSDGRPVDVRDPLHCG